MKYATNKNRCKKKDRSYRNNYKMISTVDHTGRWLKNIVSSRSATTARPGEYPLRNGAASARSDQKSIVVPRPPTARARTRAESSLAHLLHQSI